MSKALLLGILIVYGISSLGQNAPVNLVPNGSFEGHSDCPWGGGLFGMIDHWIGLHVTSDYFHRCGEPEFSVPENFSGIQAPVNPSDSAYVGTSTFTTWFPGGQESFYVELTEPLVAGSKYRVQMDVSPADYYNYVTCCMGVIFGNTAPPFPPVTSNISDVELVIDTNVIDMDTWYQMDEVYTAQGGETKMYIGNFRPDEESQPVYLGGFPEDNNIAYMYIDNVSVTLDTLTTVVHEQDLGPINISNRGTGMFEVYHKRPVQLRLLDMSGRVVLSDRLNGTTTLLDVSHLSAGIHLAVFSNEDGQRHTQKVMIQR